MLLGVLFLVTYWTACISAGQKEVFTDDAFEFFEDEAQLGDKIKRLDDIALAKWRAEQAERAEEQKEQSKKQK